MVGKIRQVFYELRNDKESMVAISLAGAALITSMLNDFIESSFISIISSMLLGAAFYAEVELCVRRKMFLSISELIKKK